MTDPSESEKFTVIPHQAYIAFEVTEDSVSITEEGEGYGENTITIYGKHNLDLVIAALQQVREGWA